MIRKKIIVAPETDFLARRRLFGLLSELYPVHFESWTEKSPGNFDAAIIWGEEGQFVRKVMTQATECLVIAQASGTKVPVDKGMVKFGNAESLDSCFRGQSMIDECLGEFPALRLQDGDEVICSVNAQPYWINRPFGQMAATIVALAPEEFSHGETVYTHFNRRRWLRLLPMLHFLKQLTAEADWEAPPVRACLMFDDPNLHWPTYGFIDLRKLVRHAQECNYHVSSAMIPFDGWFANAGVTALFKEHKANISLCMHGNDHAYLELGAPLDYRGFLRLFAQGLRRIDAFEKRSGIPVARVMVPPYGAFRESAANPMLQLGYEAVCVSRASLTAWNKEKLWSPSFGHPVTEFIGDGLPVIPRHVMAPGHDGAYRLAAFLNQPIIPHGHHQDCADGYDLLANVAQSINSLGKVVWSDMSSLSRSNYLLRRSNKTLTVKMLSRRISLTPDEDVNELIIERPWISETSSEPLICRSGNQDCFAANSARQSVVISIAARRTIEIISPPVNALDPRLIESPRFQVWTSARRILSEARDRMAPFRFGRKPAVHANGAAGNGNGK